MTMERVQRVEAAKKQYEAGIINLEAFVEVVNQVRAEEGLSEMQPVVRGNRVFLMAAQGEPSGTKTIPGSGVTSEVNGIVCPECDETWLIDVKQDVIDKHLAERHGKRLQSRSPYSRPGAR